jgi:hypothetical protein
MKDETHLRNGIGWPLGGTVIIHPARTAAEPQRRLCVFAVMPSSLPRREQARW